MNKIKILSLALMTVLIGNFIGCDEEKSVYETGSKVISMTMEEGENSMEIVVDPAKQNKITLQAQMDQPSAFGIVAGVEANSKLIDKYNAENGTHFSELPPSSYTLEVTDFIFPKYSLVSSHINVLLTPTGMQDDISYLLPLQITTIRGDEKASINEKQDVFYLIVSKLPPPKLIHLKDVELTTEIGSGKKNWFAAYATNSEGGHTFTIEEAAEQSHKMDFALVKHGSNVRLHPSIIGWKHGGDYQKYTGPYTKGFKKLTMTANMNRLFATTLFHQLNTVEELVNKVAELRQTENYNFYVADRMTSHNLQSQLTDEKRVLMIGWGPLIGQNDQFAFLYIKEVTALPGGAYTVKFDIKYLENDIRAESATVSGQNVVIDNPDYNP